MILKLRRILPLFSLAFFSVAAAKDYRIPTGIEVLSEKEIFAQWVGNTAANSSSAEYYEPPTDNQLKGRLVGRNEQHGAYGGTWRVQGQLFCIEYHRKLMKPLGNCYTVAIRGEETRIYRMDGYGMYPNGGRLKVIAGNSANL